jgi:hypothetical protein
MSINIPKVGEFACFSLFQCRVSKANRSTVWKYGVPMGISEEIEGGQAA